MITKPKKYMNPYLAGFLLGVVLLLAFFITREGLGASGAMKRVTISAVKTVAPEYAKESAFYGKYVKDGQKPMKNRLVFMVLGVLFGGFISGALSGRLKLKIEHSPKITSKTRIIAALIGGILFGIGAQLGRGCTSGAALDGMASLAAAGYIVMIAIFGTGFAVAYFFRKLWI